MQNTSSHEVAYQCLLCGPKDREILGLEQRLNDQNDAKLGLTAELVNERKSKKELERCYNSLESYLEAAMNDLDDKSKMEEALRSKWANTTRESSKTKEFQRRIAELETNFEESQKENRILGNKLHALSVRLKKAELEKGQLENDLLALHDDIMMSTNSKSLIDSPERAYGVDYSLEEDSVAGGGVSGVGYSRCLADELKDVGEEASTYSAGPATPPMGSRVETFRIGEGTPSMSSLSREGVMEAIICQIRDTLQMVDEIVETVTYLLHSLE